MKLLKAIPKPVASDKLNNKYTISRNKNYVSVLKAIKILISIITDRRLTGWKYLVLKVN